MAPPVPRWTVVAVVALACALAVSRQEAYTPPGAGPAIAGGHAATFAAFPFIASVTVPGGLTGTGFLITPRHVLTAAHLFGKGPRARHAIVKVASEAPQQATYRAGKVGASIFNDYALLTLPNASRQTPVKVHGFNATARFGKGTVATAVGLGLDGRGVPGRLNAVSVVVEAVAGADIRTAYGNGPRPGDSGSPLLVKANNEYVAIGINRGRTERHEPLAHRYINTSHVTRGLGLGFGPRDAPGFENGIRLCQLTRRQSSRCPPTHPWDAGVWDQPAVMGPAWTGKHCGKTVQCANQLNFLYLARGARANPAHYAGP